MTVTFIFTFLEACLVTLPAGIALSPLKQTGPITGMRTVAADTTVALAADQMIMGGMQFFSNLFMATQTVFFCILAFGVTKVTILRIRLMENITQQPFSLAAVRIMA